MVNVRERFFSPNRSRCDFQQAGLPDLPAYNQEVGAFNASLDLARGKFLEAKAHAHLTPQQERRWTDAEKDFSEAEIYLDRIDNRLGETAGTTYEFLALGTQVLCFDALFRQDALACAFPFAKKYTALAELLIYKDCGALIMGIYSDPASKPVSLRHLSERDFPGQYRPTDLFDLFATASTIRPFLNEVIVEKTTYPNINKARAVQASLFVEACIFSSQLDHYPETDTVVGKKALQAAYRVAQTMNAARAEVCRTLVKPSDGLRFIELKDHLMHYLNLDEITNSEELAKTKTKQLYILDFLTARSNKQIAKLYEEAWRLAKNQDEHADFYRLLADAIKTYVQNLPESSGLLTQDDLGMVFDPEGTTPPVEETQAFKDIRGLIPKILTLRQVEYALSEDAIQDWHNVVKPQSVKVRFNPNDQTTFEVILVYGQDNSSWEFKMNIDTKTKNAKEKFRWPFIEPSSEKEEFETLRRSLIAIIHAALENINHSFLQNREAAKLICIYPAVNHGKLTDNVATNTNSQPKPPKRSVVTTPVYVDHETLPTSIEVPASQKYRLAVLSHTGLRNARVFIPENITTDYLINAANSIAPENQRVRTALNNAITELRTNPYDPYTTKKLKNQRIITPDGKSHNVREVRFTRGILNGIRIFYIVMEIGGQKTVCLLKIGNHRQLETYIKNELPH